MHGKCMQSTFAHRHSSAHSFDSPNTTGFLSMQTECKLVMEFIQDDDHILSRRPQLIQLISIRFIFRKVIRLDFDRAANLFIVNDVLVTSKADKQGYKGAVILTSSALYLYDLDVNNIRKAFSCNEIILRQDKDGPHVISIEKLECAAQVGYGMPDTCYDDVNQLEFSTRVRISNDCFPIRLQMSPRFATLLISEFRFQKYIGDERLSSELETLIRNPIY